MRTVTRQRKATKTQINFYVLTPADMGYALYKVGDRWAGYGVPTFCEHLGCNEEIDRGFAFACGEEPFSEHGCDRYFCYGHRVLHWFNVGGKRQGLRVCTQCDKKRKPFPYKPEHPTWIHHLLTDESWKEWRGNHPEEVKKLLP